MGLATPTFVEAGMQAIGFNKMLRHLSLTEDIFTVLNENYDVEKKKIPDAIYMTVGGDNNEHTRRIPMIMPLQGNPRYGRQAQVGFEENLRTRWSTIYKNDYSHAVINQVFGIDAQDKNFYNIPSEIMPLLGTYFKELKGVHIRQALLRRYSENLTNALPTSAVVTREWTPNFYIKNLADASQPTFSSNNTTYTNNIGEALNSAGSGINTTLDFQYLAALQDYAFYTRRIQPLDINGQQRYIFLVPSRQAYFLKNPYNPGSFGEMWVNYNRFQDKKMNWPNELGEFGRLILIEDPRSPTLTLGGTSAPFTLTDSYLRPGNNDERSTASDAYDVGFLIGKGALVEWDAEALHYEDEDALTYGKNKGTGGFGTSGCQQVQYDTDALNDRQQFTSIACVFGRHTRVS